MEAAALWSAYLDGLPADHPHRQASYTAWGFGDSPQMADALGALVAAGIKTATASLGWMYEAEGEPLPQPGQLSVIVDSRDQALCLIETTQVMILPFDHVPDDFAYDEGEGPRTLESWRADHWAFFGRECVTLRREPSPSMPVVCERFRLLFPSRSPR